MGGVVRGGRRRTSTAEALRSRRRHEARPFRVLRVAFKGAGAEGPEALRRARSAGHPHSTSVGVGAPTLHAFESRRVAPALAVRSSGSAERRTASWDREAARLGTGTGKGPRSRSGTSANGSSFGRSRNRTCLFADAQGESSPLVGARSRLFRSGFSVRPPRGRPWVRDVDGGRTENPRDLNTRGGPGQERGSPGRRINRGLDWSPPFIVLSARGFAGGSRRARGFRSSPAEAGGLGASPP